VGKSFLAHSFLFFKELKEFAAKPSKFFNKSALEKFTEMSYA
jgi:hypothetical protein